MPRSKRKTFLTGLSRVILLESSNHYTSVQGSTKCHTPLCRLVDSYDDFHGSGKSSSVLKPDEEELIINHVKWRASVGCGLTWRGLQKLIQEILIAAKVSNPARLTGYENQGQMPNIHMVRRLADRYNLTLRSTMEISKGRQVLRHKKRVMFK